MSSEEHLEVALSSYNDKVCRLERSGTVEELLEAYINRGTVLMMMEYYVAAISDFDEAVELIESEERQGRDIDMGLFVRAYENRGQLLCGDNDELMISDYSRIVAKLPELKHGTRYFETKDIVMMCINCAEDLLDESYPENAIPFLEKAEATLFGKHDPWSENRMIDVYSDLGEAQKEMGLKDNAIQTFTDAIIIGKSLSSRRQLEDEYQLVCDYVYRGDVKESKGDVDGMIEDHLTASDILEKMLISGASTDKELMANLLNGIAAKLMDTGSVEKAEKYLVRAMKYQMPEVSDAMESLGIKKPR